MNIHDDIRRELNWNNDRILTASRDNEVLLGAPAHALQVVADDLEETYLEEEGVISWTYIRLDVSDNEVGLHFEVQYDNSQWDGLVDQIESVDTRYGRWTATKRIHDVPVSFSFSVEMPEHIVDTLVACNKIITKTEEYTTTVC